METLRDIPASVARWLEPVHSHVEPGFPGIVKAMSRAAGRVAHEVETKVSGRPRRPAARARRDNGATRTRILDAAIQAINESGYYRGASSNEIARRAGLTWGVIQHHFGDRKSLLFAVLENEMDRAIELVTSANVAGETIDERIEYVARLLYDFLAGPGWHAILQIVWDLSSDPDTEKTLLQSLDRFQRQYFALIAGLLGRVSPDAPLPEGIDMFMLASIAGLVVIRTTLGLHSKRIPSRAKLTAEQTEPGLALLIKALLALVRPEPSIP